MQDIITFIIIVVAILVLAGIIYRDSPLALADHNPHPPPERSREHFFT